MCLVTPAASAVLCLTAQGKALLIDLSEIKVLRNGGRGVVLMALDKTDSLCAVLPIDKRGATVRGLGRGGKARDDLFTMRQLADWKGARGRKGKLLEPRVKDGVLLVPKDAPDN